MTATKANTAKKATKAKTATKGSPAGTLVAFAAVVAVVAFVACISVPLTGRRQFNLFSSAKEKEMGAQAYQDILQKSKLSSDHEMIQLMRQVGYRLAKVANKPDFEWEFNLIDDDKTINAFCLPGGKVAVYTGLLPITQDEEGLAVVMGHEIGHALARHGGERMSQYISANVVGQAAGIMLGNPAAKEAFGKAYGTLVGVGVLLPYSRAHESESDYIGLITMAKAGYDPRGAIEFWKRMAAKKKGKEQIGLEKYLGTHPTDEKRIQDIQGWMNKALKYYHGVQPAQIESGQQ